MARLTVALVGLFAILYAILQIDGVSAPLEIKRVSIGSIPATLRRLPSARPAPVIVIAHGFAGSRQLMAPFAVTLARAGYVTLSFDFPGHGRNPSPMVLVDDDATAALLAALQAVVGEARARYEGDGRVGVLGHSMAADIVVRAAIADPEIAGTVAVSMFSQAVTAEAPGNLLMLVGAWETPLVAEALRVLQLAAGPEAARDRIYGSTAAQQARKVVVVPSTEHVSVLYSSRSLSEARDWFDLVFTRTYPFRADTRGPWVLLLLAGVVALGWPLSHLLPRGARRDPGTLKSGWRAILIPAIATPLILWPVPTDFLDILVADYLALHFALYGIMLAALLLHAGVWRAAWPGPKAVLSGLAASVFCILGPGLALDSYVANFMPHAGRLPLIAVLALGTLPYTLAEEALIRAPGAAWWTGLLSKFAFLLSLVAAIALDLENLFFLIIILPVIVLFFLVYGLIGRWIFASTRHPVAPGLALGLAFAWALGVTFPLAG
ncbi:MAG: alpha/beta fold hydrolase [Pseudomonadota bacterium]